MYGRGARSTVFYAKLALLSIFLFFASTIISIYFLFPEFIFSRPSGDLLSRNPLSIDLFDPSLDFFLFLINVYYESISYISGLLQEITNIISIFLDEPESKRVFYVTDFLSVISVPYIFCFMMTLFTLNAMDGDKIFWGTVISLIIITFSIFISMISNQASEQAGISYNLHYVSANALVNSMLFLIMYFFLFEIVGRYSNEVTEED